MGRPDEVFFARDDEREEIPAAEVSRPAATSLPERVSSPGSGYDTVPTSPAPKLRASRPASSPGSGQQTPQSWHSDRPGTAMSLMERVLRPFRPESEELAVYTNRVKKQARALAVADAPLAEGALEHLLSRAKYEQMLFSEAKGAISHVYQGENMPWSIRPGLQEKMRKMTTVKSEWQCWKICFEKMEWT